MESFSNDDVFDQGPHGIVGYGHDDVSFVLRQQVRDG